MKGKERSPVKRRCRPAEDGARDRGGRGGGSGKRSSSLGSGCGHSAASSRRSLHGDYGAAAGTRPPGGADVPAADPSRSRSGSRSGSRPRSNPESSEQVTSRSEPMTSRSEYRTLKISGLGGQLSDGEVEDGLFHEFKRFGDVSVKISRENDGARVALVNFRRAEDARAAKHARGKLVLYDRPLKIETVYLTPPGPPTPPGPQGYRDLRLQQLATGRLAPPHLRDLDRDRDFSLFESRIRPAFIPDCAAVFHGDEELLSPDDHRANDHDHRANDHRANDHRANDHRANDHRANDHRANDHRANDHRANDHRANDHRANDHRANDHRANDHRANDHRANDHRANDHRANDHRANDHDHRANDHRANDHRANDHRANDHRADDGANRTLFLGNLDVGVAESELRRAFDRFGVVTEVDIKRATRGQNATYGFIKFENLDMARRAKVAMAGKLVGQNAVRIGYGKPTPTTRLWVGGLGPWAPLAALAKEFDRFGTIRTIDYRGGEAWAYIQYESLDAAAAACSHMRGFPLGGPDRRLRVDFADTERRHQPAPFLPLPLPHYDLVSAPFAPRLARDRSPPPPARFRDRDVYAAAAAAAEWSGLAVHDRMRGAGFDPLDQERRPRDAWSLDRGELDSSRKRRHDDGWRSDRSPDANDNIARRHGGGSLAHSPSASSWDGGRQHDPERPPRSSRTSPRPDRHDSEKRRRTLSPADGRRAARKEERPEPAPLSSSSRSNQQAAAAAAAGGGQRLSPVWRGVLLLKNSSFPAALHLLHGDAALASGVLLDEQLKISQRLRLDPTKLDDVSRRIKAAGADGYAVLLALPGTDGAAPADGGGSTERPLKNLVTYLTQKDAAGIITVPVATGGGGGGGVLHVFPPCDFTQQFLDPSAVGQSEDEFMVMVIIRGASS